jgi:hypothetical protein
LTLTDTTAGLTRWISVAKDGVGGDWRSEVMTAAAWAGANANIAAPPDATSANAAADASIRL